MDPLSITASIIAVLGAVSATGKTICKIKALRRAPEELAALLSEVDALRNVLIIAQAGLRRVHDTPAFEEVKEPLQQLFARAETSGIELHRLLEYQLKRSEELDDKGRLKVDRSEWLKSGAELERIKQRIRDSRENLQIALTSLSLSTGAYTREHAMQLSSARRQRNAIPTSHVRPKILVSESRDEPKDDAALVRRSTQSIVHSLTGDPSKLEPRRVMAIKADDPIETTPAWDSNRQPHDSGSDLPFPFAIDCPFRCKCQCHNCMRCQTPGWLKDSLGELTISFTPILLSQPCNSSECRRSLRKAYLRYIFPAWFAYRALVVKVCSGTLSGLGAIWSLRVPIVVKHPAVWDAISKGNLQYIQHCLEHRTLDPRMIAPSGENLLQYALQENQIQLYVFLHQAGFDNLFDGIGSGSTAASRAIVRHRPYLSTDSETISEQLGFLNLHCSLALPQHEKSTIDDIIREAHLEVNTQDLAGMTPLHWACYCQDTNAVELLLAWSANPNTTDYCGVTPLHLACQQGDITLIRTLLKSGAKADTTDDNGNTAIFWTNSADVLGLLSYWGANLEHRNNHGQTILHVFTARGVDMSACIKALAVHGADNQAVDKIGLTPFHYAILRDVPSALNALRTAWKPKVHHNNASHSRLKTNYLHLAAQYAGVDVMRELMLCNLTLQDPDQISSQGLTPSDYFYKIRDNTCTTVRPPFEEEEAIWLALIAAARSQCLCSAKPLPAVLLEQPVDIFESRQSLEGEDEDEVFVDALEC